MPPQNAEFDVSALIGAVYDAALAELPLPRFIETLSAALADSGMVLVVQEETRGAAADAPGGGGVVIRERPLDAELGSDLVAEPLPPSPADASAPMVLAYFKSTDPDRRARIALRRRDDGEGAAKPVPAALPALAAHVSRALRFHRMLIGRRAQAAASHAVLDNIPVGIMLVNATGRVAHSNAAADDILAQRDGLSVDRGLLSAATPRETRRLRRVIEGVAAGSGRQDRTPVGVLRFERPSLSRAWLVVAAPVGVGSPDDRVADLAALFITDGSHNPEIPPEVVQRLFLVTPAEARLLVALVDGRSLDEAAELFQVSKNTLRNQLNQIFRKTETSKQSELVRMVLASPAPLLMGASRRKSG